LGPTDCFSQQQYATEGHTNRVLFTSLQLVITAWQMHKLVDWQQHGHHLICSPGKNVKINRFLNIMQLLLR